MRENLTLTNDKAAWSIVGALSDLISHLGRTLDI